MMDIGNIFDWILVIFIYLAVGFGYTAISDSFAGISEANEKTVSKIFFWPIWLVRAVVVLALKSTIALLRLFLISIGEVP